eukprot:COSAG02_NODE_3577_length_6537_cov_17.172414_2_plen_126_part_00
MPHLAKVGYGAHLRHLAMSRVGAPSSARAMLVEQGGAADEGGGDSPSSSAFLQLVGVLGRGRCGRAGAATGRGGHCLELPLDVLSNLILVRRRVSSVGRRALTDGGHDSTTSTLAEERLVGNDSL